MTSLKCLCFIVFISIFTLSAHAELEEMDEPELQELTGQKGVTIDVEHEELSIGEAAFQDGEGGGFVLVQGINLGSNGDREIIFNDTHK